MPSYVYNLTHCETGEPMQDFFIFIQNHWLPATAVVVVFILLIIIEYIRGQRGAKRVSPIELTQLINHQNAVVVDIRGKEAFLTGHIIGALSIPLEELTNKYKKLDKFKSQPIVLVCAAGLESPKAVSILAKYGVNPLILAGGIRGWRDAEMPLVKD